MFAIRVYSLSGQPSTVAEKLESLICTSHWIRTAITVYVIQWDANKPSSWSIPNFVSSFWQSTVRYSGALSIWMEKSVFPVGNQMEQVFPQKTFRKKGNTSRGIPLSSFSPELPENHCTIYFITLVPCSLAKISDFAREWRPLSCLSVQYAVFILNKRNVFWRHRSEKKQSYHLATKCIDFLGQYTFRNEPNHSRDTATCLTLNRSAISRVFSSFAMHHKKIETCFCAPITCLPNGFPKGSCLPCPLSSLLTEVGSGFEIHQWNIEGYCLFEIPMTPIQTSPGN